MAIENANTQSNSFAGAQCSGCESHQVDFGKLKKRLEELNLSCKGKLPEPGMDSSESVKKYFVWPTNELPDKVYKSTNNTDEFNMRCALGQELLARLNVVKEKKRYDKPVSFSVGNAEFKKYLQSVIESPEFHKRIEESSMPQKSHYWFRTINLLPETTAKDYLRCADYPGSINKALNKDWVKVASDLWVAYIKTTEWDDE